MKRYIATTAAAILACLSANAQNFNPKVEVTNDFETNMKDVSKRTLKMNVPDSLTSFDYKFDYSVFENPYKGAYEFSPYAVQVAPDAQVYSGQRFYLRAGAGYTIHPVLDFVYSPDPKDSFRMSVYNNAGGYYGKYRNIYSNGGATLVDNGSRRNGMDLSEKFGVELSKNFKPVLLNVGAEYNGLFTQGLFQTEAKPLAMFHQGKLGVGVVSNPGSMFDYEANASYSYGYETFESISEGLFRLNGGFAPKLDKIYDIRVDADFLTGSLAVGSNRLVNEIAIKPKFLLNAGFLDLKAGVNLSSATGLNLHVYPDIHIDVKLFKGAAAFYAVFTGTDRACTYSSYKFQNHFFDTANYVSVQEAIARGGEASDMFVGYREKMDAYAGFKGHAGSHFSFDIKGGYRSFDNAPVTILDQVSLPVFNVNYKPTVGRSDYNQVFAQLSMNVTTERFDMDADVLYRNCFNTPAYVLDPALVAGQIAMTYNWNKRFYLGLCAEAATERSVTAPVKLAIPWYVDLGVNAEYRLNRKWAIWVKGGNLLNQTIQRTPVYAEQGINFTAGICLRLR